MPEEEKKETKDEDKVILQVHMHCDTCRNEVVNSIKDYPGVEDIEIDTKGHKVTVKGKVDAKKLFERVKKKSGKRAKKVLYPEEPPKKDEAAKEEKKEDKDKKEPLDVSVVLKVTMHCVLHEGEENCLRSRSGFHTIGVYDVNMEGNKVTLKGKDLDPTKVCEQLAKKSRKHVEIVPLKEEEKQKGKEETEGAKKDEKEEDKKDEDAKKEGDGEDHHVTPPSYFTEDNPHECSLM